MDDRRKHARYALTAYVDYSGNEVLLYHRIENISLGGICLKTTSAEEVGTLVDLVINFPDLETNLAVQGEVVWVSSETPADLGIRYLDLDETRKEVLRRYIAQVQAQRKNP